ncbi:hypothetical protein GCM10009627_14860 [Curtobacterium herbarum]|uniref:Uncharacterized protein n=1 Tax=Curtobacterium herbarum TaxID=150122 RepID=A0ABN1ZBZ8_9MICO
MPQTLNALPGVHVPACVACNNALGTYLEEPAKNLVRRILGHTDSHDDLLISADDSDALARWLLKVGLLSYLPERRFDLPAMNEDSDVPVLSRVRGDWLSWMTVGSPPPDSFSVYITRRELDGSDPDPEPGDQQWIPLPHPVVDGKDLDFMLRAFGFRGVNVTIVWHPGWPIDHPQVTDGRAVQLWPSPHEFNFGSMPQVSTKELRFLDPPGNELSMDAATFEERISTPLSPTSGLLQGLFGVDDGAN